MRPEMRISVVMPAYNAEGTIAEAVESVLAQSHSEWELIIVDDGSTDGTLSIAMEYARRDGRIRVLESKRNMGVSAARRRGVCAARSEWIAFLDSDDIWLPEKLEKQAAVQRETGAAIVFTGSGFMNGDGRRIGWTLHVPEEIGYRRLLRQNRISNSSVLISRNCYLKNETAGGDIHEDFACWLNALRSGEIARGIDEALMIYRVSAGSKSGNKLRSARMNFHTYRAVGLGVLQALGYMLCYGINGLRKYWNLRRAAR